MNPYLLTAKCVEHQMSKKDFAEKIGLNNLALWRRLTLQVEWTRDEIQRVIDVLDLSSEDVMAIFFTSFVPKTDTK